MRCATTQFMRLFCILTCALSISFSSHAGWIDARRDFLEGNYEDAIRQADEGLEGYGSPEEWSLVKLESLLALGRYGDAGAALEKAMDRSYRSIRIRLLGRRILRSLGKINDADQLLLEIDRLAGRNARFYLNDPDDSVALGRTALLLGADPRQVLDNFYEPVRQRFPDQKAAYLAIGDLELEKSEFGDAARTFRRALLKFEDDPDVEFGLARAFQSSDQREMLTRIGHVLDVNERHVPALLMLADHLINAEQFEEADKQLGKVLDINPRHPVAWAYKAALAHFDNDPEGEKQAVASATRLWKDNPEVYHTIGLKLSQRYRFLEGATYQRIACVADPSYLPAKIQLAQDLLRLGNEDEGWKLALEVHEADGYDKSAFNLATLHDTMQKFAGIENEHFILRMGADEAKIYGGRALALLERARETLCEKYRFELTYPITVEVFPEQKDFAVRTFGMPDNPGYLGVCFGSVITANSPASQASSPTNWEAVLWHEFCHVVTLQMSRNKMPRWLSEGISVYEERQENPTWGQWMNREYRRRVEAGRLTPIRDMSSAFLAPESNMDLQFAYYQSSMVVEFIVEHHGIDALRDVLLDLGNGMPMNPALEAHVAPLKELEKDFEDYAKRVAHDMAPDLVFDEFSKGAFGEIDPETAAKLHPRNYWALMEHARHAISEKDWDTAAGVLEKVVDAYPRQTEPDSALLLLADVYKAQERTAEERAMLEKLAGMQNDVLPVYNRLMELALADGDWEAARKNALRYIAVNPLNSGPYSVLARACDQLGDRHLGIEALSALIELDPLNPADLHYRLAVLMEEVGDPEAKRQVLKALEEAPRFREAQQLLLRLTDINPDDES